MKRQYCNKEIKRYGLYLLLTTTKNEQVAWSPCVSVAMTVTLVDPTAKIVPDAGSDFTKTPSPELSTAAGSVKSTYVG